MASISSPGIGSGLDVNGLVTKLMAVEQQPIAVLNSKEASYQATLSAYGSLKGALSTLQSAAQALNKTAVFSGTKANVAADATFSASASASSVPGSYTVEVKQLAVANQWSGIFDNATTTLGMRAGTLRIQVGNGAPVDVAIAADATLDDVRNAINNADAGAAATIVSGKIGGVDKAELIVTATTSGASNGLTFSNPDGNLGTLTSALSDTRPGADSQVLINGTVLASGSGNTISDAIDGIALTLNSADEVGTSHALTVSRDTSSAAIAINNFVKAYNDLNTAIKSLTAYDASTKQAATLLGDSTVQAIQTQLRHTLTRVIGAGNAGVSRLSDLGVAFQRDGSLSVDSSKLQSVLNDPNKKVSALFVAAGDVNGYGALVDSLITGMLGTGGILSARTDGINASIKDIDNQRNALNGRMDQIEARYRSQFTALDTLISSMNATSTYLTQQLASLASLTTQGTK